MNYTTKEAYEYLNAIETYFFGDLFLFQKLSKEAEDEESISALTTTQTTDGPPNSGSLGSMFPGSPSPIFRATIPFTLICFSCMDVVGYLTRISSSLTAHQKSTENIRHFFTHVTSGPNTDELNCLIKMYRHGLSHNYFPKLGIGLSYHSKNPNKLFFKDVGNSPVLNVNVLLGYFISGFANIKNDMTLGKTIYGNYNKMKNYYLANDAFNIVL